MTTPISIPRAGRLAAALLLVAAAISATPAQQAANQASAQAQAQQEVTARPTFNWTNIQQAMAVPLGTRVYMQATVVSISPPRPESRQPYSVYLADSTGTMRTVIFQDTWNKIPNPAWIQPGARVDLFAKITEYRGERQIEIDQPNYIRQTPGTVPVDGAAMRTNRDGAVTFTLISVGSLNITHVGQAVRVRGTVVAYEEPANDRTPFRVMVRDDSGEVEAIYWRKVAEKITPENRPHVGQPIEISGTAGEYLGKMQLRVDEPQYVSRTFQVNARSPRVSTNETATAQSGESRTN
jgi:DNA/RNA endonuclease YhcR with UshA esterase domain